MLSLTSPSSLLKVPLNHGSIGTSWDLINYRRESLYRARLKNAEKCHFKHYCTNLLIRPALEERHNRRFFHQGEYLFQKHTLCSLSYVSGVIQPCTTQQALHRQCLPHSPLGSRHPHPLPLLRPHLFNIRKTKSRRWSMKKSAKRFLFGNFVRAQPTIGY